MTFSIYYKKDKPYRLCNQNELFQKYYFMNYIFVYKQLILQWIICISYCLMNKKVIRSRSLRWKWKTAPHPWKRVTFTKEEPPSNFCLNELQVIRKSLLWKRCLEYKCIQFIPGFVRILFQFFAIDLLLGIFKKNILAQLNKINSINYKRYTKI